LIQVNPIKEIAEERPFSNREVKITISFISVGIVKSPVMHLYMCFSLIIVFTIYRRYYCCS